ncbi:MAG: YdcF family protein [bacterium]
MIFKNKFKKILLSLGFILIVIYAILTIRIYYYANIDDAQKADAIVVLGAAQWNGSPSPILKTRLDHALSLYKKGFSSKFILTGGIGKEEKISEARAGKDYLIKNGVDSENIFMEEKGHTSLESLREAAQILEKQNFKSIILVSDGFHMIRIKKMAKDLGIKAFASPVLAKESIISSNYVKIKYIMREVFVYIMYLLFKM